MPRAPRNYAAERARAYARAEALGLSRSAALGKPNRGEASKQALGVDVRTKAGQAAAEARALQVGKALPPTGRRPTAKAKAAGRQIRTGDLGAIQTTILQLAPTRKVQLLINVTDPVTGARRTIQPWGNYGISAGALQGLIRRAGGLLPAVVNAMGQAQAGSTDRDALTAAAAGLGGVIGDVTVIWQ